MINPEYFNWGGAFQQGIQQSQDNRRRNALLDLEQRQYGLQERRLGMAEKEYADEQQRRAEAMRQAQTNESRGFRALAAARGDKASGVALLQELGLPVELADDPDSAELYAALAEKFGGFQTQDKSVGQLYQVEGPQGAQYVTAQEAIGRKPYQKPEGPRPTGQLYQVVGPDGKPRYVTAEQALGQQPFIKKGDEKPPPDPVAQAQDAANVLSAIDNAEKLIGANTTGFIGQQLGNLGGTEAYDLRSALDTVKASIGFDRLQRMREESKTGGALGQVAVRELELLQATIASLDANQSGSQLRSNLRRVRAQYERAMSAYQRAMSQQNESAGDWSITPVR